MSLNKDNFFSNFQYLGASTYGEIWRFNLREDINKLSPAYIPVTTYSNWQQRAVIPENIMALMHEVIAERAEVVRKVKDIYSYGIFSNAGTKVQDEIAYNAHLEEVIKTFLLNNLKSLRKGKKIYFNYIEEMLPFQFKYEGTVRAVKVDQDNKPILDANGKKIYEERLRDEPVNTSFGINFFALSLIDNKGWKTFSLSNTKSLSESLITLKDDLWSFITASIKVEKLLHFENNKNKHLAGLEIILGNAEVLVFRVTDHKNPKNIPTDIESIVTKFKPFNFHTNGLIFADMDGVFNTVELNEDRTFKRFLPLHVNTVEEAISMWEAEYSLIYDSAE